MNKKAYIDALGAEWKTPLHLAVEKGNIEIIKLLLDNRAEINKKDKDEKTPFAYADDNLAYEIVKNILNNENITDEKKREFFLLKNKNGKTPLHLAVEKENEEIVKLLLDKGANVSGDYTDDDKDNNNKIPISSIKSSRIKEMLSDALKKSNEMKEKPKEGVDDKVPSTLDNPENSGDKQNVEEKDEFDGNEQTRKKEKLDSNESQALNTTTSNGDSQPNTITSDENQQSNTTTSNGDSQPNTIIPSENQQSDATTSNGDSQPNTIMPSENQPSNIIVPNEDSQPKSTLQKETLLQESYIKQAEKIDCNDTFMEKKEAEEEINKIIEPTSDNRLMEAKARKFVEFDKIYKKVKGEFKSEKSTMIKCMVRSGYENNTYIQSPEEKNKEDTKNVLAAISKVELDSIDPEIKKDVKQFKFIVKQNIDSNKGTKSITFSGNEFLYGGEGKFTIEVPMYSTSPTVIQYARDEGFEKLFDALQNGKYPFDRMNPRAEVTVYNDKGEKLKYKNKNTKIRIKKELESFFEESSKVCANPPQSLRTH